MQPEEQIQALRDYVSVTLLGGLKVTDDEELLLSGKIDSLGVMSLVSFVEQTYSIEIPLEDVTLENLSSIDAISDYAENRHIAVS
ncbi:MULTISPECIES: acyl carrier protein [Ruegeria]|jgi:acyl carrier protein|uniref:Phosphopantetheine attachment site n=1 Tax=Ruegeria atlantica TaxID=81569 RepID=A0A0P1E0K3_9RHOB|nr:MULTISPECIES: acyl carrier protein [Ruegeria]CUH41144.1 Phosphopantetheine attachment site [Ruegeria atlantica]